MATTRAQAQWYGFTQEEIDCGTGLPPVAMTADELRMQQLDHKDDPGRVTAELEVIDAVTLLDGFYDGRSVRPLLPPTCVLTRWGIEWLRRSLFGDISVERVSRAVIQDLDIEANDPMDYVEEHTHSYSRNVVVQGKVIRQETKEKTKKILAKGKRNNFAAALAHEAYLKFGARPMTEANCLVTRKWLAKLLDNNGKYKDLRTVDRNIAIDRALFLSFVPTDAFRTMKLVAGSKAWEKRVDPKGLLGGIFGKAFMIVREEVPDGIVLD